MLEGFYQWVKNIAGYLIFMSLILKLLPEEKNVKYIKYFMGMVLVLIVLAPAGRLFRLDEVFDAFAASFTAQENAQEFKEELALKGEAYTDTVIFQYESRAAESVRAFLMENGYGEAAVTVQLETDPESDSFGQMNALEVDFGKEEADDSPIVIEKNRIKIVDEDTGGEEPESASYREQAEAASLRQLLSGKFGVAQDAIVIKNQ